MLVFGRVVLIILVTISALMALFGAISIPLGYAQSRDPQGKRAWGKVATTKLLHQRIPMLRFASPEQQVDLFNQVMSLLGWVKVYLAWAMLLSSGATVALGVALLVTFPDQPLSVICSLVVFFTLIVLAQAVGVALGFRAATRRANEARGAGAAGAWERRRVSDYRAPWLDALFALEAPLALACCGYVALSVPVLPAVQTPHNGNPPFPTWPLLALVAVGMVVATLVWFLAPRAVANAPRAFASPYAGLSSDAEDLLRGLFISLAGRRCWRFVNLGLALAGLVMVLGGTVFSLASGAALITLGLALNLALSLLALARGREGGKRVGWPWRPAPAMSAPTATPAQP